MFNLHLSHEKALKRIGRYLKATRDKGLVLNPSGQLKVDAYPDADFAGLWGHKKVTNPAQRVVRDSCLLFLIAQWSGYPNCKLRLPCQQWRLKLLFWPIVVESCFQ